MKTLLACTMILIVCLGDASLFAEDTGRVLLGHGSGGVSALDMSPNGLFLVSGGDDFTARLWDIQKGKELEIIYTGLDAEGFVPRSDPPPNILSVALSPDGNFAAVGTRDGVAQIVNVSTSDISATFLGHASGIRALSFHPNGDLLATGSHDATIRLWNLKTKKLVRILEGHTDRVRAVKFSSDGTRMVSASDDGTVRYWDMKTGQVVNTIALDAGAVRSLSLAQGNGYIAAGCEDGSIHTWKMGEESQRWTAQGHRGAVLAVAINANNDFLVSGAKMREFVFGISRRERN